MKFITGSDSRLRWWGVLCCSDGCLENTQEAVGDPSCNPPVAKNDNVEPFFFILTLTGPVLPKQHTQFCLLKFLRISLKPVDANRVMLKMLLNQFITYRWQPRC
ncbi:hypothetical protein AVEN_104115-1 [Araneus ventricosus]|uniref:Uncharacterized protein n=1 Tax=Araneus ventricosus TaxID=182803 RepID=A0A4Y2J8C8_ARAVE|nr:hypothetical protein AVEN_104115-1 [Araneus ventricosus]